MAGKHSPQATQKLATLQTMVDRVQAVYGQVERYAATRDPEQAQALTMPLRRALGKLKLDLMGAGLDSLSQLAGSMEIATRRGGSQQNRARILREGIGSMRFQIEQEQRRVMAEDERE